MTDLKIGFLAIGEGGSNIVEYAAEKGFSTIAINSAKIDLDKLKIIPEDCKIHLDGWEGAGRNRETGKQAVLAHTKSIFKKVSEKFKDFDMVFVVASTAGGTGSGGLPVTIEILTELEIPIGAVTILPDKNESPKAHMNALECFSDLSQFEQLNSTFIIDNDRANTIFKGYDKSEIYQSSNKQLIDNFAEICKLTSQASFVSNFDKNDLLEILNERGYTLISKVTVPTDELNNSDDIISTIRNSWDMVSSPNVGYGQIVKAGIFGIVPKKLTSMIDAKRIFEETGIPYDITEAYYSNEDKENCTFYTILSGLSFPMSRLKKMEQEMQLIESELIEKIETSRTQSFQTSGWGSKFKRKENKVTGQMSRILTEKI